MADFIQENAEQVPLEQHLNDFSLKERFGLEDPKSLTKAHRSAYNATHDYFYKIAKTKDTYENPKFDGRIIGRSFFVDKNTFQETLEKTHRNLNASTKEKVSEIENTNNTKTLDNLEHAMNALHTRKGWADNIFTRLWDRMPWSEKSRVNKAIEKRRQDLMPEASRTQAEESQQPIGRARLPEPKLQPELTGPSPDTEPDPMTDFAAYVKNMKKQNPLQRPPTRE